MAVSPTNYIAPVKYGHWDVDERLTQGKGGIEGLGMVATYRGCTGVALVSLLSMILTSSLSLHESEMGSMVVQNPPTPLWAAFLPRG